MPGRRRSLSFFLTYFLSIFLEIFSLFESMRNPFLFQFSWYSFFSQPKKWLNRGERSNIYMKHVCILLQRIETWKNRKIGVFRQHCGFHQLFLCTANKSHSVEGWLQFFYFFQVSLHSKALCRHVSGRCCSFLPIQPFVLLFHLSRFSFST